MATAAPVGDLATQILHALDDKSPLLSSEAFPTTPFAEIKGALDRLASREMVRYETIDREEALLEPEGEQIAANGSHEARVFEALRTAVEGLTLQELEKAIGDKNVVKIGQGRAFRDKWISKTQGQSLDDAHLDLNYNELLSLMIDWCCRWQVQSRRMCQLHGLSRGLERLRRGANPSACSRKNQFRTRRRSKCRRSSRPELIPTQRRWLT